jgi:hypothetical protein
MKRFFALVLALLLCFNFAPSASAESVSGLVPCSESAAYQQRAKSFRNTTSDPESGRKRAERYSQALCGPEGFVRERIEAYAASGVNVLNIIPVGGNPTATIEKLKTWVS